VRWAFGKYVFDPAKNVLDGPQGKTLLEPKASSLLSYFIQNPHRDINRDELMQTVWDGQIVSDGAVNRVVVQLRKALGDDGKIKHLIVTAPKIGYRFVGTLEPAAEDKLQTTQQFGHRIVPSIIAISVLLALAFFVFLSKRANAPTYNNASLSPVVRLADQQFAPAPAHNTEQIVFSQKTEFGAQLYWMPSQTAVPVPIGAQGGTATAAQWGPQDKTLIYRFMTDETCAFHMIEIQGGVASEPQTVYDCAPSNHVSFAFNTDGNKLYFAEQASAFAPYYIYELGMDTHSTRRISQPVANGRGNFYIDKHPQTGKLLLLSDEAPGQTSAYELDTDKGTYTRLIGWPYKIDFAVWGHSPNTIVHPDAHPSYQLIETNVRTQFTQVLASDSRRIKEPARIGNGKDYLFTSYLQNQDILLDGRLMDKLNSSVMDYLPTLSRSGTKLAFISKRTGVSKVWLTDLKTGELTMLSPLEAGHSLLAADWSFDDQRLLITTSAGLVVIDLKTQAIIHRLNPPLAAYAAKWADADEITYSLREGNRWQLYQHNIITNKGEAKSPNWAFAIPGPHTSVFLDQNYQLFRSDGHPLNTACATPLRLQDLSMRLYEDDLFCISSQDPTNILRYKNLTGLEVISSAAPNLRHFSVSKGRIARTSLTSAESDIMRTNFVSGN